MPNKCVQYKSFPTDFMFTLRGFMFTVLKHMFTDHRLMFTELEHKNIHYQKRFIT